MPETHYATSLSSPLVGPVDMSTPHNSNDLANVTRQIRVLTDGNLAVLWWDNQESIEPVLAGQVWDWRIKRLKATGTTATCRGYY